MDGARERQMIEPMSTISTFSGFTMARLGIMASQKALEVTGNNISNINTPGYTRQRLEQKSLYVGGADRYASQFDVRVGSGALTTGVSQLRDPYLDIRYRNEVSNVYYYDGKLSVLEDLAMIFDEVGKGNEDNGVIEAGLSDLLEQLQNMNTEHAGTAEFDAAVRESAKSLVGWFNEYAGQLEKLQATTEKNLREKISRMNNILHGIRELNESIKKAEIANGAMSEAERKEGLIGERGSQALELRDERNKLIDELAQLVDIDVKYSDEPIGCGMYVEKLTITLSGRTDAVLVDGVFGANVSFQQVPKTDKDGDLVDEDGNKLPAGADPVLIDDPAYKLHISALEDVRGEIIGAGRNGSTPVDLKELDLKSGSIQALREMLTRNGEFSTEAEVNGVTVGGVNDGSGDPKASTKRGIPYYQKALDALARQFAKVFNDANTFDPANPDENWVYEQPVTDPPVVQDKYKDYVAQSGPLFSSVADGDDPNNITAANICISNKWAHREVSILQTKKESEMKQLDPDDPNSQWGPLSSANSNIAHLITAMQSDYEYRADDMADLVDGVLYKPGAYYKGSFHGMLTYVNEVLAEDGKSTAEKLDNYNAAAQDLAVSRDSVSGVDLNDEAMNLMQYQKSYSAACRLMTTLDELLDKLINGTGIAGR